MIYFDNAATTFPKPGCVVQAVQQAMLYYGANPGRGGHDLSMQTGRMIHRCRERAAALFGCQPEQVVFTKNCTESLNIVIKGLAQPGDHFIISDLEHNAVYRVMEQLRRQGIIEYSVAAVEENEQKTVWNFEHLIRPNTRMIVCTQASNVFGMRVPVERIGAMARCRGVMMTVDAAQSAGLLPLDLRRQAIDYLCLPGHKGLYGPAGTGLLIVNCPVLPQPLLSGGTGSFSMEPVMPDLLPDRLEGGTVNTPGILGLSAGISFVLQNTPQRLYEKEMQLCASLYEQLCGIRGVQLYSQPPCIGKNLPVIALNLGNLDSTTAAECLNEKGIAVRAGFHCAALAHRKMHTDRDGVVRMSLGAFNTRAQADACCAAVRAILS